MINWRLMVAGVAAAIVLGWLLAAVVSNVLEVPPV